MHIKGGFADGLGRVATEAKHRRQRQISVSHHVCANYKTSVYDAKGCAEFFFDESLR